MADNYLVTALLESIMFAVQYKTLADSELQENWWQKFWRLITLMIVHY